MRPKILSGRIEVADVEGFFKDLRELDYVIQVLDAEIVCGRRHLEFAIEKARKSFENNPISNSLSMEILLYVVGKRQINKAIKEAGITEGENEVALIALTNKNKEKIVEDVGLEMDDSLLVYKEEKLSKIKDVFKITDKELEAVGRDKICKLVQERVALLELNK